MLACRRATVGDLLLYFEWANDEEVRKNSFNPQKITLEQHKKWFEKKINDSDCLMFIVSIKENEVGQIRFDKISDDSFETDFSIEKNFRGKGFGSDVIKIGTQELFKTRPLIKRVIGKVKKENFPSKKSFLNAHFKRLENVDENCEIDVYYFDNELYGSTSNPGIGD